MVDIPLIVNADTSSIVKGKADLTGFKEALGGVKTQTDAVTGASQRGTGATRTYTDSQRQGSRAAQDATRAAREQAVAVDRVAQAYRLAKGAIVGFIGLAIVRDLQNTTMSLQKIDMTFQAVTGSAAEARAEMNYVRKAADSLGQDVLTAAGAYAKLLAATKGTNITLQESRTVFEGITAAATAYGLSQYELEGALLAVQQMISKGSVQAEELRGQLGERLPGAFQIAARSMGMSTQELSKALELGQVAADDFVRAFGTQLQAEFGGFAQTAQTATRSVNELENSMTALKESIISGGFRDAFFTILNALNQIAQTKGVQAAAKAIGAAFRVIADAAALVLGYIEAIADSTAVEAAFNVMAAALAFLGDNLNVVVGILANFAAIVAGKVLISGVLALVTTIQTFGGVLATAATLTGGFGAVLTVLSGPIGWLLGALAAATAAFFLFGDSTKSVEDATRDMQRALSDVEGSISKLETLQSRLTEGYVAMGTAAAQGSKAQETAAATNVASLLKEIETQNKLIEGQRAILQNKITLAEEANRQAQADFGIESYTGSMESLRDDEASGKITGNERLEEQRRIQKMTNEELLEYRRQQLLVELELGEVLSEREYQFLAQANAIMEGEQAVDDMTYSYDQLGITLAKNAEEFAKTVAAAKELNNVKEGVTPLLTSIQAMGSSLQLAAQDSIALEAAIQQVFAAETPQAMVDAIEQVRTILAKADGDTSRLDGALKGVLAVLGRMAGVNIAAPINTATTAAYGLATAINTAAAAQRQFDRGNQEYSGRGGDPRDFMDGGPKPFVPSEDVVKAADAMLNPSVGGSGGGGGGGAMRNAYKEQQLDLTKRLTEAERERAAVLSGQDMERYAAVQQAINAATAEGTELTEGQIDALTQQANAVFDLEENVKSLKDAFDAIESAAVSFGSAMGKALGDSLFGIGNFKDAAKAAFKDLVSTVLEELGKLAASKILQMILGGGLGGGGFSLGGMFGGGGGGGFSFGLANGGVLEANTFAMTSGGRMGQVAENGPEAVLPLSRGPDGKLGVQNAGGGGGVTINITNNAPVEVATSQRDDGGIDIVISAAAKATADGVARGTGDLARVLEQTYGLRRQGR